MTSLPHFFFNNEETTATMDKHNGRRNKAYYRAARRNHIAKKRKISDEIYDGGWQCPDGALSKGKIHCLKAIQYIKIIHSIFRYYLQIWI